MNIPAEAFKAAEAALDLHGEYSTNDQTAEIVLGASAPYIQIAVLRRAIIRLTTACTQFGTP